MKFLVPALLLSMLLVACIGQRNITTSQSYSSLDCDVLARKQRQQYRIAMREAKTNARRKSPTQKFREKKATGRIETAETMDILMVPCPSETGTLSTYSPSLVPGVSKPSVSNLIRKELLKDEQLVVITCPDVPPNERPESVSAFTKFQNDAMIWPALLLGGALGILSMTLFQSQARAMARWSKENKFKARSALVGLKTGIAIGCVMLGDKLYTSGYAVPEFAQIISLGSLGVALAFYPSRYFPSGAPAFGFIERKFYDASIVTAGAIIMLYAGNRYDVNLQVAHAAQSATVAHVTLPDGIGLQSRHISIVKREFKQNLKIFVKDPPKEITKGEKIALSVLVVLLGIAVTFGVAALACSLACNGSEIAAFIVGAGGAGLIAWGLTASLRSIHRRPTKKRVKRVESAA